MKELEDVKLIKVPCYVAVGQLSELDDVELHGFSDSSQIAYSAVIYVRFKVNGVYFLKLLASKTKVAPLKKTSIPRLELLACLLLTKLMNTVKTSLYVPKMNLKEVIYWTDSKICAHWIRHSNKDWVPWVQHRVNFIRGLMDRNNWCWVDSERNPADIPTREISCEELKKCDLWWHGPTFLKDDNRSVWPNQAITDGEARSESVKIELKKTLKVMTCCSIVQQNASETKVNLHETFGMNRYSTLFRLLVVTSYVLT